MGSTMEVVKVGVGALLAMLLFAAVVVMFVRDVTQKKHTVLRNYPRVGHLRYWFEKLGEYFRQYFFANDREEMPFNPSRATGPIARGKDEGGTIGFGSTYDLHAPGALIFVNAPFPVLESERLPTPPMSIGEGYCERPSSRRSVVNISGMSFGAISEPAVRALSRGAKEAGCWLDTGEGGLSPFHLEGELRRDHANRHGQVRRARRVRQPRRGPAAEIAAHENVRAFEDQAVAERGARQGRHRCPARR